LHATHTWYEEISGQLLASPVEQLLKLRPTHRALEALHTCDREVAAETIRARRRIDSRFQQLLVQATLDLCEPWRIWRGGNRVAEWQGWEQRRSTYAKEAIALLDRYKVWASRGVTDPHPRMRENRRTLPPKCGGGSNTPLRRYLRWNSLVAI